MKSAMLKAQIQNQDSSEPSKMSYTKRKFKYKQSSNINNSIKVLVSTYHYILAFLIIINVVNLICGVTSLEINQNNYNGQIFSHSDKENDPDYWLKSGRDALIQALRYEVNTQKAKNAILFIGDGMSLSTITAARILYGQLLNRSGEEELLSFERLNNLALVKTYNVDQQIPDSAATATAILSGVKTNFYTLGVNANVKLNDTDCQKIQQNKVVSIIKQAIDAGKSTGIVTNTRITHATPAAAYAHVSNRRWECDTHLPQTLDPMCKDIARQLIEDEPGSKINVIMGGGRRCFFGSNNMDPSSRRLAGIRADGRNLISQWIDKRKSNNEHYAFVNMTGDLRSIDTDKVDYLLGLFSYSHMNYEELRLDTQDGEPSLSEMTETAIKILSKNPKGYLLIVESGRIDHAHHENVAGVALRETIALSWSVQKALKMIDQRDTLIAVTSDHAHALTINGLAPRGNPILGLSRFKENSTQVPYTTLIYGNGPGHHHPRADPSTGPNSSDTPYYVQYAAIHQEEAFHDGSDVAVFASGPYAHLFQGVQEQSYIAHVFAYAMCIGDYSNRTHCRDQRSPDQTQNHNHYRLNNNNPNSMDEVGRRVSKSATDTAKSSSIFAGSLNHFLGSSSSAAYSLNSEIVTIIPYTIIITLFSSAYLCLSKWA